MKREGRLDHVSKLLLLHKCWFASLLTKDVIEEVHEEQHPGHQGHKDDDLERRVEEEVATLCFAVSASF